MISTDNQPNYSNNNLFTPPPNIQKGSSLGVGTKDSQKSRGSGVPAHIQMGFGNFNEELFLNEAPNELFERPRAQTSYGKTSIGGKTTAASSSPFNENKQTPKTAADNLINTYKPPYPQPQPISQIPGYMNNYANSVGGMAPQHQMPQGGFNPQSNPSLPPQGYNYGNFNFTNQNAPQHWHPSSGSMPPGQPYPNKASPGAIHQQKISSRQHTVILTIFLLILAFLIIFIIFFFLS